MHKVKKFLYIMFVQVGVRMLPLCISHDSFCICGLLSVFLYAFFKRNPKLILTWHFVTWLVHADILNHLCQHSDSCMRTPWLMLVNNLIIKTVKSLTFYKSLDTQLWANYLISLALISNVCFNFTLFTILSSGSFTWGFSSLR